MNIAIIGTGNIGSGLAAVLARTKNKVTVAGIADADGPALAEKLTAEKKVTLIGTTFANAVKAADIVILAIPFGAITDVAKAADFSGKTVVDVTNPIEADFSGIVIGHTSSAAEVVQKLVPKAKVLKAFNTVFAQVYDQGLSFGDRKVPAFIASDDEAAKLSIISLANDAGFDAVDSGPLKNARYIEPLGYLNIQFGYMLGRGTQIAPAWLSR
jgi:8-hydroxy-5-deazaflavin:NADPH oxidoreductase